MMAVSAVLSVAGGAKQASAMRQQGDQMRAAREFEAQQQRDAANSSVATAQREGAEEERKARYMASRAIALGAASGAMGDAVYDIASDIEGEGAVRAAYKIYSGEERARQQLMSAESSEWMGLNEQQGMETKADSAITSSIGSAVGSMGSMYAKFGMGGPGAATTAAPTGSAGYSSLFYNTPR